jgi:hypothetical protein
MREDPRKDPEEGSKKGKKKGKSAGNQKRVPQRLNAKQKENRETWRKKEDIVQTCKKLEEKSQHQYQR